MAPPRSANQTPRENEGTGYVGIFVTPSHEAKNGGLMFIVERPKSVEPLRELLPFVAMGWAPEYVSPEGYCCGVRALTRALQNTAKHYMGDRGVIPEAYTFNRLTTMKDPNYKKWRDELANYMNNGKIDEAGNRFVGTNYAFFTNATTENKEGFDRDSYFEVDDLRYILEWINCQTETPAPIKFRLGILLEYNRDRQFTPIIFNPLADLDSEDYRVLWLLKKSNHWESIGRNPSHKVIQVFYNWGLEKAARDIIISKRLFFATKYAVEEQKKLIQTGNPHGFKILEFKEHECVYMHPSQAGNGMHFPEDHKSETGWWFALTTKSRIHNKWPKLEDERPESGSQQAWVTDAFNLVPALKYVETEPAVAGGRKRHQWRKVIGDKTGVPYNPDDFKSDTWRNQQAL